MKLETDTMIFHYKILSKIGEGGMGEVYLAEDTRLNRKIAIKFLSDEFGKNSEKLNRFIQEAQATSALNHPNILTVYEIGEFEETHYIATEFIEGETLRAMISGKDAMPLNKILKIAIQTAEALSAAHQAGIAHRDIKPENIMIRRDGYVKVLDFGLAKLTEKKSRKLISLEGETKALVNTEPGMIMGTVSYMSPEQARGKETDARTDIWSLGVVLYELLAGKIPFTGETINHTIVSILEKEPRLLDNVPDELQRIVRKTLAKDKDDRYQTARDLLIDLKSLRRDLDFQGELERSVTPERIAADEKGTIIQAAEAGQTIEESIPNTDTKISGMLSTGIRQHKLGAAIAAAAALVILSGFGYGIYQFINRPEPVAPSAGSLNLKIRRLTGDGKTISAKISPDGKFVAFITKNSVRIKQIETGSEVEVIPRDEFVGIGSLAFSPDSNFVYFEGKKSVDENSGIYRVPSLGGRFEKLIPEGWGVRVSSDGKMIAFGRGSADGIQQSYYVANADGSEERLVVGLQDKTKFFAGPPSWSPDGKHFAVYLGDDSLSPNPKWMPVIISISDGTFQNLGEKYFSVNGELVWRADGTAVYTDASDRGSIDDQIWEIQYPSGQNRALTQPGIDYSGVSISADGRSIVTVEGRQTSGLWVSPDADPKNAKQIIPDNALIIGLSWTPDSKLVYVSNQSGGNEIWIADSSGENARQLTNDRELKFDLDVSPDGQRIVYEGNGQQLYEVDIDGGRAVKLISGAKPRFSPDGKWIIFFNWVVPQGYSILRIPAGGGEPERLTSYVSQDPQYSPDGKYFACRLGDEKGQNWDRIGIIPADGGDPVKIIQLPPNSGGRPHWTPDGKGVTYYKDGLWVQPIDGGNPRKLEIPKYRSAGLWRFEYSRDGKKVAFTLGESHRDAVLLTDFR